jgi:hypothetical protein
VAEKRVSIVMGKTILRKVTIFETVSSLKSKLFVVLKFKKQKQPVLMSSYSMQKADERRVTLGDKIGIARQRLDALTMSDFLEQPIEDLFTSIDEENDCLTDKLVCWPRLTEICMFDCDTAILNNSELFEKLAPNLLKLDLGLNPIKLLDADVFKYADKLIKLCLNLSETTNPMLRNETFHGLVNLRVLDVNVENLDSLEPFNCLLNLEELILFVGGKKSPIKRLDAFPSQLSKLRFLELALLCELEWIAPTAFDHLTCLKRFEFECFSNSEIQPPLEIGISPCFLQVIGIKTLRLLGSQSSVANIETIKLFSLDPDVSYRWKSVKLTRLECYWPLSGLKRLSAWPLDEKSLMFEQMVNLEFLSLRLSDLFVLSMSGLGCLCKLAELQFSFHNDGMSF